MSTKKNPQRPCARCGVKGERRRTTALCHDCNTVLSKEERALWNNQPVQLAEKEAA